MTRPIGMVLIMALVFLLIMALLVSAMLLVSQLSHKAAYAGQQQLQISQRTLQQHLTETQLVPPDLPVQRHELQQCPAQYAAWSDGVLQCEVLQLTTETYSDNGHFYAGYSSLMLQQSLALEED
jgi:5-bromo-4-chloroindolyl phosphate hydrolysis protein